MNLKITTIVLIFAIAFSCENTSQLSDQETETDSKNIKALQEEIMKEHLVNGAWKYPLYSQERQREIDKGLAKDSTIAYLWQQKSMPLFKQGKYEIGMEYVDQVVKYDPDRWHDYRAFIKCIFAKTYRDAIADFEDCKAEYGNRIVMDHSYNFYIGLSHLQLNQFEKAEECFRIDHDSILVEQGEDWLHHIDLFYYAISKYELYETDEALKLFDKTLELFPQFSDAQYYKAKCLKRMGHHQQAEALIATGRQNGEAGCTINDDNTVYERYPYQVRWN